MPTLNVNLTNLLADFVQKKVESGAYRSASELVRDALRLLRREDELDAAKLAILQREVARGLEEAEQGSFETRSLDEIAAEILGESGSGQA